MNGKSYLEVARTRLEYIEWRCWYDSGHLDGLRFNWTNGISTQKYAEGLNYEMKRLNINKF